MRGRNRSSGLHARVQIPAFPALDSQRRQDAGREGSGVDADSVRALLDFGADGVPVDDDEAVRRLVLQEGLSDPAQVALPLFVKRHARSDPGMNKEIVAEAA